MSQYYNSYPADAGPPSMALPPPPPLQSKGLCGTACCIAVGGIAQILLGILSVAFGAVIISSGPLGLVYQFYVPLWAGSVFLIAGVFGALTICCNSADNFYRNCLTTVYIVFSAIAALVAIAQAGWEGYLAFAFGLASQFYCDILDSGSVVEGFADALNVACADFNLVYYMHIALSAIGFIELLVAIIGTISGCITCCGDQDTQTDNQMIVTGQNMQPLANAYNGNAMSYAQSPPPKYAHSTISYAQSPNRGYAQGPSPHYHDYNDYYNGQRTAYQPGGYM